jgi:hypothetical protein
MFDSLTAWGTRISLKDRIKASAGKVLVFRWAGKILTNIVICMEVTSCFKKYSKGYGA